MSCLNITVPPLPSLAAGFTVPAFPIPSFAGNVGECCHFSIFAAPAANLPIPSIPGAVFATISPGTATVDAYLAAVDLASVNCPLE